MSGFTYYIKTFVSGSGAIAKLAGTARSADSAVRGIGTAARSSSSAVTSLGNNGSSALNALRGSAAGLVAQIGTVATAFSSLSANADMDSLNRSIKFAGGAEGAQNLSTVNQMVKDMKLPLKESLEGFKTLSGGLMGTGLEGQATDIFKAMSEGATVMGLSADESKGALLALSQMASKGTVSAEELRGQLGERLPGAFNIAARAMGMTTKELGKMMERGDLAATDFLPKFAAELHKTFGPGVADALNGPRAQFNEMNNAILTLKTVLGAELMPAATSLINNVLIPGAKWIGENAKVLGLLGTTIGGVYAATKIYSATAAIATLFTGGFTGAVGLLSAALLANPIGFVIGGLVTMGAAVVYAWNKFEGFRGFIMGMWGVMKEFGSMIYEQMIAPLMSLGKVLMGTLTFNPVMIQEGLQDGIKAAQKLFESPSVTARLSNAFNNGYNGAVTKLAATQADLRGAYEQERDDRQPTYKGALRKVFAGGGNGPSETQKKNGRQAQEISRGISDGGPRNITINIGEMGNGFTIHTTNIKEGGQQTHDYFIKLIAQAINSANQVQK